MAGVWDDALRAIPTDWLNRVFSEALAAQRTPFPLTHAEVLTAWDNLLQERQAAAQPVNTTHLLPGAPPDAYFVGNMLTVLKAFCEEHRDPLPLPVRLKYALAAVEAGARAGNFRDLLESTGQPTLYGALTDLGIAVDPPPPPKPGTVGYWAKVGDAL